MKIKLYPDLLKGPLEASVSGDALTINGEVFDFSGIPDGYRLPASAVTNRFFMEDSREFIERKGNTLYLTLKLPVEMDSPEEVRNPSEPIVIDARSGPVKFPDTSPSVPTLIESPEIIEGSENGGSEQA
ncbi:hypothetical protein V6L78_19695 [Pseudomonas canadensis]|uniref:hypothetical protein n=1 Tax=Pseudomonas canadensis TaxID=915099 RepID=UPI0030D05EF5